MGRGVVENHSPIKYNFLRHLCVWGVGSFFLISLQNRSFSLTLLLAVGILGKDVEVFRPHGVIAGGVCLV